MEQVTFRRDVRTLEAAGKTLVTAEDGGLVFLARDGRIWLIPPDEQVKQTKDDAPFKSLSREELTKRILAELPPGFRTHDTKHYLIFYDTSPGYADWCGSLFENLYRAFTNFWTRRGFELSEPEFPLVAIVFADTQAYQKFARAELGDGGDTVIGYFGLMTNRMTMYDLTGVAVGQGRRQGGTSAQIAEVLAQPEAARLVPTIIHEATHQIAFNCGLHTRLSDCPRWFSEGIAVYFEATDLRGAKGWSRIGAVNRPRLEQFEQYRRRRPVNSLETLLRDDRRFTDPKQGLDAYAEAWALTYFLIRQHPKEYLEYLRLLGPKPPLVSDEPKTRLDEFRRVFGDLKTLDAEFLRYMGRVR